MCISCGREFERDTLIYTCSSCGDLLDVVVEPKSLFRRDTLQGRVDSMWRYKELLPSFDKGLVTLGEGYTRLVECKKLAKWIGVRSLYLKLDGLNPTGSFKDRGMSVGTSTALRLRMKRVICASTGNTSASLSAYSARAGLECIVIIPREKVAVGKLFQARLFNSKVFQMVGGFDDAMTVVLKCAQALDAYILNSINPWRLEGQKTTAYEIWEQLGRTDIAVAVPVGNCGNISAIWKGFKELGIHGVIKDLPIMIGAQAEGAAPLVEYWEKGLETIRPWKNPETIATAIRIGNPVNWKKAVRALRESKGLITAVSDDDVVKALRAMSSLEGLAGEPSSAVAIAASKKLVDEGRIDPDTTLVSVVTGNPLKDTSDYLISWNEPVKITDANEIIGYFSRQK